MPSRHHHDEFEHNQFLGKEMKHFSQAGFDLDRIHIKVSSASRSITPEHTFIYPP
jgi:phosphoenolpyruvate carboxykinase (ATP)